MKFYAAETLINAPLETVWSIITDGAAYQSWDSGVTKIEGTISHGSKIKIFATVSGGRGFPVHVDLDRGAHIMTWSGGMPLGLFRGVRTFSVTEEEKSTRLKVREIYTGALHTLIWKSMPNLQPSFDQYVNGVKKKAEVNETPTR